MALAALVQACTLVHEIASTGSCHQADANLCLRGIFALDPRSIEDVYG